MEQIINKAVNSLVETQWQEDIKSRSSLKYLNPDSVKVGESHHIWSSVRNNIYDSRGAQLKCRNLTGAYILQSNRAVFDQYAVDPTCKICKSGPETRQHFLAECQSLQEVRQKVFTKLRAATDVNLLETVVVSGCDATQLILDPSVFFENKTVIDTIELISRELIPNLHRTLTKLLLEKQRQQGLASSHLNFFADSFIKQRRPRIQTKKSKKSTSIRRFAVK